MRRTIAGFHKMCYFEAENFRRSPADKTPYQGTETRRGERSDNCS